MQIQISQSIIEVDSVIMSYETAENYTHLDKALDSFIMTMRNDFRLRYNHDISELLIKSKLSTFNPKILLFGSKNKYFFDWCSKKDNRKLINAIIKYQLPNKLESWKCR